jgi:hypothetical protein
MLFFDKLIIFLKIYHIFAKIDVKFIIQLSSFILSFYILSKRHYRRITKYLMIEAVDKLKFT